MSDEPMRIIKPPSREKLDPTWQARCPQCYCEFEYKRHHVQHSQRDGSWVHCPGCRYAIDHK